MDGERLGINRKIHCLIKKVQSECYKNETISDERYYKLLKKYVVDLSQKYDELTKYFLNITNIEDALYSNFSPLPLNENKVKCRSIATSIGACTLLPENCLPYKRKLKCEIQEFESKATTLILKYNKCLDVIEDLRKVTPKGKTGDIIIKFGLDKNSDLICMYCDLNPYDSTIAINPTVYLFFGEYHTWERRLFMYIHYQDMAGALEIPDFRTEKPRCGHGKFVLNNLELIVREYNKRIMKIRERNPDFVIYLPIEYIHGSIAPNESVISYQDLYNLYDKCGYITDGHLYRKV